MADKRCIVCRRETYGAACCSLSHFRKYERNKERYERKKLVREIKEKANDQRKSTNERRKEYLESLKPQQTFWEH
jgi:hypothetical protein